MYDCFMISPVSNEPAEQSHTSANTAVAVTLDGVVIDWMTGLRSHVAARIGVAPQRLPSNVSWNLAEWGVDDPRPYLKGFLTSPMAGRVKPIKGAAEGLAKLREAGLAVLSVTRRQHMVGDDPDSQAIAREITLQWCVDNPELGIQPDDLVFTNDPVAVEAKVWVDNAPRRVERLVAENKPVWLLPQPWNRSVRNRPGIKVLFDGWESIDDLIADQTDNV